MFDQFGMACLAAALWTLFGYDLRDSAMLSPVATQPTPAALPALACAQS